LEQVDRESYESAVVAAQLAWGNQAFAAAHAAGQALPLDQAVTDALVLADELTNDTDA
jgi:hypothetical protein